jgi:integrase
MLIKRWNKSRNAFLYYPRLIDETGKKRFFTPGHTSKKMAEQYESKLKREIDEKRMFPERFLPKIKFSEFILDYLQKHASKKRSFRHYVSIAKKLVEFFGDFYLHEISRYQIETYYSMRGKAVGVCMINREVTILKGILTKACDWKFLTVNPVKGFKLEKEKPRLRFLRESEQYRLVESCGKEPKAPYLRPAVIIDLHTGLRKEELFSLKWEHISLKRNVLKVEDGKGGYTRYVPISETVKVQLARLKEKERGAYVFHDQYGRRIKDIKRSFGSAVERAELSDVRFHDLRRTFGTMCVFKNVPPKTLQKWMGHKSIETTMKYYVVSPEDFEQEAIKRLDGGMDTYMDTSVRQGGKGNSQPLDLNGEPWRIRTSDPLIKSQLLYQLS